MPIHFFATMVIGQGAIRLLATSLVVSFLTSLYLRGKFVKGMFCYWVVAHALGAIFTASVVWYYSKDLDLFMAAVYGAVGLIFYFLMYVVPPYRSTSSLAFMQLQKPDWNTEQLSTLVGWRQSTAMWSMGGYVLLLFCISFAQPLPDILVETVEMLLPGLTWLYITFGTWGAALIALSAFYVIQMGYSIIRMRMSRKAMDRQLGRPATDEEFLAVYLGGLGEEDQ